MNIIAYAIGRESFDDKNGNGIFDGNDAITQDLAEPSQGTAWFWDFDGNGAKDLADNMFNGICDSTHSKCSTRKYAPLSATTTITI